MSISMLRRPVLSILACTALALGAVGCGSDDKADNATTSEGATFTGDPVTVITAAPVDTAAINQPEILNAATGAVRYLNDHGGLGGHEVKLIACNDGNDTNMAADCARQAVEKKAVAMLGGFTTNGATIAPILEDAGIPWIGGPGFSPNELSDDGSFLLLSGAPTFAGIGAKAVDDGCKTITTVLYDTPTTGKAIDLINLGLASRGAGEATNVKVPTTTTDFASVAQSAAEADCAIVGLPNDQTVAVAVAGASLDLDTKYYLLSGALNDTTVSGAKGALAGAVSAGNFVVASDPVWDDAKAQRDDVDWTGLYNQNTWAAYMVLASVMEGQTDITAATVKDAMSKAKDVDAGGLMAPVDFTTPFAVPGLERVYNRQVIFTREQDGQVVADGDFADLGVFFGQ